MMQTVFVGNFGEYPTKTVDFPHRKDGRPDRRFSIGKRIIQWENHLLAEELLAAQRGENFSPVEFEDWNAA